ncbi:MAG: chemotaxis response regulator protein-glutamate methylesterase [Deltaproteobacteria bacterium]|nr:MAG: chemotaxis response regulator protein-glutamate methylesterase [Deltaproteobacteria bacterium]
MIFSKPLRVLVVDDTIVYRKAVSDILAELPGVEVAGVAHNGKIALAKIKSLQPDLLTLDIEMPEMNGLEVLAELQKNFPQIGAVMLSTLTGEGSIMSIKALELGAFDFILKPQNSGQLAESKKEIKDKLAPILKAFAASRRTPAGRPAAGKSFGTFGQKIKGRTNTAPVPRKGKSEIVAIGISTGGPNALSRMLPMLPGDLGVPVVIVQHMPPIFTASLANSLDKKCALKVKEAENGEVLSNNVVYIAPGGKQMKLAARASGLERIVKITNDPPENSCRPAADYLFRSVADYYVGRTTAVIMTGMGSDGTKGLQMLKNKGALIIAQDEASCVVYGMPKEPVETGLADIVAPLGRIAGEIVKSIR